MSVWQQLLYLLEEVFKDGGDVMRWEVREVHLLLLHLKGLTDLLDARFGPTHTIHPLRGKTKKTPKVSHLEMDILFCTFSVTVVVNNTWTVRARVSISDVQCSTTKGTCSGLSRSSRERSTPNTVPFLCSHSSWHTSIHFLCKASPHWRCNGMEDREQKQFYSSSVMFLRTPCYCKCLPPHTSSHSTPLTTM